MRTAMAISALLLGACATVDPDIELDQEAVEAGADGKADGASGLVRLERATATEVATSVAEVQGAALLACFEAYRATLDADATYLTPTVAGRFTEVANLTGYEACAHPGDLEQIVTGVLEARGVTRALPTTVVAGIAAWAEPQLEAASVAGYVDLQEVPLLFYYDVVRVQDANAMAREQHPAGIDLAALRAQWAEVRADSGLDRAYLNPVTFAPGVLDSTAIFRNLRAAFPLHGLRLASTGYTAIRDFAEASEGPEGDPAFEPIATALRKSSIRKRFYFVTNDEAWSSNALIVVDQHGQAYGMKMGYSE